MTFRDDSKTCCNRVLSCADVAKTQRMQAMAAIQVDDLQADIKGHWLPADDSDSDVEILDVSLQAPGSQKVRSAARCLQDVPAICLLALP